MEALRPMLIDNTTFSSALKQELGTFCIKIQHEQWQGSHLRHNHIFGIALWISCIACDRYLLVNFTHRLLVIIVMWLIFSSPVKLSWIIYSFHPKIN